jgi:hypothetical protein
MTMDTDPMIIGVQLPEYDVGLTVHSHRRGSTARVRPILVADPAVRRHIMRATLATIAVNARRSPRQHPAAP